MTLHVEVYIALYIYIYMITVESNLSNISFAIKSKIFNREATTFLNTRASFEYIKRVISKFLVFTE